MAVRAVRCQLSKEGAQGRRSARSLEVHNLLVAIQGGVERSSNNNPHDNHQHTITPYIHSIVTLSSFGRRKHINNANLEHR